MPLLRTFRPADSFVQANSPAARTGTAVRPRITNRALTGNRSSSPRLDKSLTREQRIASGFASNAPARPAAIAPIINTGGGGGFSGGGGGGGGGSTGGFDPNQADDAVAEAEAASLESLRAARLEAALAAIGAQFDTVEGGLQGQQRDLVSLFAQLTSQNQRDTRNTTRAVQNNAADRGLGRSGIFAQNLAEGLAPLAEQQAQTVGQLNPEEGNEGTQIRDIMSALALLGQNRANAEASAELESEQDELDIAQLIALVTAGLQ